MNLTAEFRFKYETHCHTSPVSKCAKASAEETVRFYKSIGYDGIFITNHFLDGNINPEARSLSYRDQIDYYFADYEEAVAAGDKAAAEEALKNAVSTISKATSKGVYHKNNCARKVSRLSKAVNSIG